MSKEILVSCGRAWQKYSNAMELKKKEAEMSEEGLKRKRKHEEIQDPVSKKKKMELDTSTHLKGKNGKESRQVHNIKVKLL